MDSFSASETYSSYTYWHSEPATNIFEEEMRKDVEEIANRQKSTKSNPKNKGSTATTPTPTTAIVKANSDKLLAIVPVTEIAVKRA